MAKPYLGRPNRRDVRAILAIVLAILLLFSGGVRAPLGPVMDAPAWSIGDFWEYSFNTTFEGTVSLDGRARADVLSVRNVTVAGVSQDVYVIDTLGTGILEGVFASESGTIPAQGAWNLTGEQFITVASRKIVKTLIDIRASGEAQVPLFGTAGFTFQWWNSTTYRVEADAWTYPVPLGRSATVTLNSSWTTGANFTLASLLTLRDSDTGAATYDLILELITTASVAVPAGTFEVYVIAETGSDGSREEFYYAPAAGNNARTVSFNGNGEEVSRTELLAFRYQAAGPKPDLVLLGGLVVGGIGVAAVLGIVGVRALRRRKAREQELTPPSLREPPTSGP